MSWTITYDHLDREAVWIDGHGDTVDKETPGAKRFYIHDGDDELYYSGWLLEDDKCPYGYCAWESALSFGASTAGATTIKDGRKQPVI